MIFGLIDILILQMIFAAIIGIAIHMGKKADARCKPIKTHVNPWAPARKCAP